MQGVREDLRPRRNLEAERKLKLLILEIKAMVLNGQRQIEEKVRQAAECVVTPGRCLNLDVIEEYETWTDLDTLAMDLTMEVPTDVHLTKDEFIGLAHWIKGSVLNGMEGTQRSYHKYYYDMLLFYVFPGEVSYDIMEQIEEGTPIEEIAAHLYPV